MNNREFETQMCAVVKEAMLRGLTEIEGSINWPYEQKTVPFLVKIIIDKPEPDDPKQKTEGNIISHGKVIIRGSFDNE